MAGGRAFLVVALLGLAAAQDTTVVSTEDPDDEDEFEWAVILTTVAYAALVVGVGIYFTCTNPAFHTLKLKGTRRHNTTLFSTVSKSWQTIRERD